MFSYLRIQPPKPQPVSVKMRATICQASDPSPQTANMVVLFKAEEAGLNLELPLRKTNGAYCSRISWSNVRTRTGLDCRRCFLECRRRYTAQNHTLEGDPHRKYCSHQT